MHQKKTKKKQQWVTDHSEVIKIQRDKAKPAYQRVKTQDSYQNWHLLATKTVDSFRNDKINSRKKYVKELRKQPKSIIPKKHIA